MQSFIQQSRSITRPSWTTTFNHLHQHNFQCIMSFLFSERNHKSLSYLTQTLPCQIRWLVSSSPNHHHHDHDLVNSWWSSRRESVPTVKEFWDTCASQQMSQYDNLSKLGHPPKIFSLFQTSSSPSSSSEYKKIQLIVKIVSPFSQELNSTQTNSKSQLHHLLYVHFRRHSSETWSHLWRAAFPKAFPQHPALPPPSPPPPPPPPPPHNPPPLHNFFTTFLLESQFRRERSRRALLHPR